MFQLLPSFEVGRFVVALVASALAILCARADASCGNYLHTRNGGPQETLDNLRLGLLSKNPLENPAMRLSLVIPGVQGTPLSPARPCSGPFCRQSPVGPAGAVLDPGHWNSPLKIAAKSGSGMLLPEPIRARRAATIGDTRLQPGFPPGIDIPPELVTD